MVTQAVLSYLLTHNLFFSTPVPELNENDDEECKLRGTVVQVEEGTTDWERKYKPQFVKLDRCQGSCWGKGSDIGKTCQATGQKDVNINVSHTSHENKKKVITVTRITHTECSCAVDKSGKRNVFYNIR